MLARLIEALAESRCSVVGLPLQLIAKQSLLQMFGTRVQSHVRVAAWAELAMPSSAMLARIQENRIIFENGEARVEPEGGLGEGLLLLCAGGRPFNGITLYGSSLE